MAFVSGPGSMPAIRMLPAVGCKRPFASLIRVVLPLPLGPKQAHDAAKADVQLDVIEGVCPLLIGFRQALTS